MNGKWTCPNCGYENPGIRMTCMNCPYDSYKGKTVEAMKTTEKARFWFLAAFLGPFVVTLPMYSLYSILGNWIFLLLLWLLLILFRSESHIPKQILLLLPGIWVLLLLPLLILLGDGEYWSYLVYPFLVLQGAIIVLWLMAWLNRSIRDR